MKRLLIVLQLSVVSVFAQVQIDAPLVVSDGVDSISLSFGIRSTCGTWCPPFPGDTVHGYCLDSTLPPSPPGGVFDARFTWPRGGSGYVCYDQGTHHDYRRFAAVTQRDTFRVKAQLGSGWNMVLSWRHGLSSLFTQLTLRYFDQITGSNFNVNMLTDTIADVTDNGDPATVNIYSGGLVASAEDPPRSTPVRFELDQSYPNPFNPATTIEYQLPSQVYVTLKVYDVLGREVATLVDGVEGPGHKSVRWNAGGVASGVYFYRLAAGPFTSVKKLLLLR